MYYQNLNSKGGMNDTAKNYGPKLYPVHNPACNHSPSNTETVEEENPGGRRA
jgi:hypothetical protein